MIANGAAGETLSEMEQVLGGGLSLEQINEYLPAYAYGLPSSDIVSLQINNAIWFTEGYPIRKDFLQTNANYYGAELFQTVFDSASVDEINRWVSENTDGMIEEFIDDIPSETLSVLVNTLLFDGSWENSFDEKESIEAPFITYDGKTQMALMMKSEEQIFLSGKDYKGFLKYYDGRDYAFAAIQPEKAIDIFSFVQNLTGDSLLEILRNAKNDTVNIMLPKFNFEYEADLKDTMSSMGMPAAFLPDQADFSAMGDMSVGNIYLQKLIQKTKIEISESGTKAAAVTGGFKGVDSAGNNVFLVRPFVYMIIDTKTNLPIFMGVLTEIPA
jgi:serpin B